MNTGWPQLITAFVLAFVVIAHISKHGEPRPTYNGPGKFIDALMFAGLLYWGGFWTVHP